MFNLFHINDGDRNDRADAGNNDEQASNKPQVEELSKDEIRRRRLARVAELAGSPIQQESSKTASPAERIPDKVLGAPPSLPVPAVVVKQSTPVPTSPPPIPVSQSQFTPSPSLKANVGAIALNTVLEYALHATLKDPSTRQSYDYDKTLYYVNIGEDVISSSNISSVLCYILSTFDLVGVNGAIGYLCASYKRLVSKEGSLATEKIRDDYKNCKTQIVSLIVSSMTTPDMFGANSENSIVQFYKILTASEDISSLFREVVDELTNQQCREEILEKIFTLIYFNFSQIPPSGNRSVMDDHSSLITLLKTLVLSDKRVGYAFTSFKNFRLPQNIAEGNPQKIPDFLLHNPAAAEKFGVRGAAVPHQTLLGMILRASPIPQDPQMVAMFSKAHAQPGNITMGSINTVRKILETNRNAAADIILALLKSTKEYPTKDPAIQWIVEAISLNKEAVKGQPSPLLGANSGFLVNLGGVMLNLCRPILADPEKASKVDWEYVVSVEGSIIFPLDDTKLFISEAEAKSFVLSTKPLNFISQSFFMCWRALHLGASQLCDHYIDEIRRLSHFRSGLDTNEPRAVYSLVSKIIVDLQIFDPGFVVEMLQFFVSASKSFLRTFDDPSASLSNESWQVPMNKLTSAQHRLLQMVPEHLIDDILTVILTIGRVDPMTLSKVPLDSVLSLIVFFLRRPWAAKSPHLRAKFGLVLFQVFLPVSEKSDADYWTNQTHLKDGPQSSLLSSHIECQKYLAPALLLLYGDVEKTGYYDKLTNRKSIMVVLKHLWTLPTHRAAFRGIVNSYDDLDPTEVPSTSAAAEPSNPQSSNIVDISKNYFIRFANGMMNEANSLISVTMEQLSEIKKIQDEMKSPEWATKSEEQIKQIQEKYESCEQSCKGSAGLCLETLNMLNYLTSDEVIRGPFLEHESILSRFIDTLLSVLFKLVGPKSLEIKVDNMDSYNFQPKVMLREIAMALLNFADISKFHEAIGINSFYKNDEEFRRAIATIHRLKLLKPAEEQKLNGLVESVGNLKNYFAVLKELENDAPDDFLDPLVCCLMKDPVLLPTSNLIVDRATIAQQLLNNEIDPFNRKPLTLDMVIPQLELKQRIADWIALKMSERESK